MYWKILGVARQSVIFTHQAPEIAPNFEKSHPLG